MAPLLATKVPVAASGSLLKLDAYGISSRLLLGRSGVSTGTNLVVEMTPRSVSVGRVVDVSCAPFSGGSRTHASIKTCGTATSSLAIMPFNLAISGGEAQTRIQLL